MGFGYPGGPVINEIALKGDSGAVDFPRADLGESLDFSFSGLKTAVLNHVRKHSDMSKEDIAASFQAAVIDVLIDKVMTAATNTGIKRISLSGGVAANSTLRARLKKEADTRGMRLYLPSFYLCTDNAAMIASAGYFRFKNGDIAGYSLNPKAYLPLGDRA